MTTDQCIINLYPILFSECRSKACSGHRRISGKVSGLILDVVTDVKVGLRTSQTCISSYKRSHVKTMKQILTNLQSFKMQLEINFTKLQNFIEFCFMYIFCLQQCSVADCSIEWHFYVYFKIQAQVHQSKYQKLLNKVFYRFSIRKLNSLNLFYNTLLTHRYNTAKYFM